MWYFNNIEMEFDEVTPWHGGLEQLFFKKKPRTRIETNLIAIIVPILIALSLPLSHPLRQNKALIQPLTYYTTLLTDLPWPRTPQACPVRTFLSELETRPIFFLLFPFVLSHSWLHCRSRSRFDSFLFFTATIPEPSLNHPYTHTPGNK